MYGRAPVRRIICRVGRVARPRTALVTFALLKTAADGLFMTISVLYFTRVLRLPLGEVGAGLSIANLAAVAAGIPLGHLADRYGARRTLLVLTAVLGAAVPCYLAVRSFAGFLAVALIATVAQRTGRSTLPAAIAEFISPPDRVALRARIQIVSNIGIGAGAVGATAGLYDGSRGAYEVLILGCSLGYLLSVVPLLAPRRAVHAPAGRAGPVAALFRDRPYLGFAALNTVLALNSDLIGIGVPVWVGEHTAAPSWTLGMLIVVNTAGVILFQARVGRAAVDVPASARISRAAGLWLGGACLLYALAGSRGPVAAVLVLLLAATAHMGGEIRQVTGEWGIGFGLAPDGTHGRYQGLLGMGRALNGALAPVVIVAAIGMWGTTGWLALALCFVAAGLTVPVVVHGRP